MQSSLTLNGWRRRCFSSLCGAGMTLFSALTIRHFFAANYPATLFGGSFCDINAFFNCNSSAYSKIAQIWGVPLGYFGLFLGALVILAAVFPSEPFERTNRAIALPNALGVVALLLYSVFYLKSLCLLCSGYYVFSLASFALFWKYSVDGERRGWLRWLRFSPRYAAAMAILLAAGAWSFQAFHTAKRQAQSGDAAQRLVRQYFSLPQVQTPSIVSPYWIARSTPRFEDAPIQVVEYADFLCDDCLYLHGQLERLQKDFQGKINIAFQFFPLEAKCNNVVAKNKHPGACDLAYIAAHDPAKFQQIHDEIYANFRQAKRPEWRADLARRHGVEAALTDPRTREAVQRIIQTGAEYEKTSDKYSHGVRSTPTLIVNNRMIIGTFPYEQLRAIFQAVADQRQPRTFLENWEETGK